MRTKKLVPLLIALSASLVALSATSPPAQAAAPTAIPSDSRPSTGRATLEVASGFEGNLSLDVDPASCEEIGCAQLINGTDSVTGHDWASPVFGSRPYFHLISNPGVTPATATDLMNNTRDRVSGHCVANNATTALHSTVKERQIEAAQNAFQVSAPSDPQKFYTKYWMKLPTDYVKNMGKYGWSVISEFKAVQDDPSTFSRAILYIYTDIDGTPFWHLKGDNNSTGEYETVDFWFESNRDAPVPLGEWFSVETYFDRGTPGVADGKAWVAINGKTTFDKRNVLLNGTSGNPLWLIMPWNNYSNVGATEALYDDFEMWSGGIPRTPVFDCASIKPSKPTKPEPLPKDPQPGGATQVLSSGFSGKLTTALSTADCTAAGCVQKINGVDSRTQFDWASKVLGDRPEIMLSAGDGADAATVAASTEAKLADVKGPDGRTSTVLKSTVKAPFPAKAGRQPRILARI